MFEFKNLHPTRARLMHARVAGTLAEPATGTDSSTVAGALVVTVAAILLSVGALAFYYTVVSS
jgi:hypothetical protein